jgi:hypothetical protein
VNGVQLSYLDDVMIYREIRYIVLKVARRRLPAGVLITLAAGIKEPFMSQQEFAPGSQSNQQDSLNEGDEIQDLRYPYSWSGKLDQNAVPRDEPPSSYDARVTQQDYNAQSSSNAGFPGSSQPQAETQYAPRGEDRTAYEQGYRPNNAYNAGQNRQGVPPWARPQRHPRHPSRFAFILLILLGIGLFQLLFLNGGIFVGFATGLLGTLITLVFFALLVPLIVVFVIFGAVMRMLRPRRMRYRYWRRGPWWY